MSTLKDFSQTSQTYYTWKIIYRRGHPGFSETDIDYSTINYNDKESALQAAKEAVELIRGYSDTRCIRSIEVLTHKVKVLDKD